MTDTTPVMKKRRRVVGAPRASRGLIFRPFILRGASHAEAVRGKIDSMHLPVTWPLRFVDEEGDEEWLSDPAHVETNVEFVTDFDPPYECFDSAGRPVRLIAWQLQLLLCRTVASPSWRESIAYYGDLDRGIIEERVEGRPHRALSGWNTKHPTATPTAWDSFVLAPAVPPGVLLTEDVDIDPARFDDAWIGARLRAARRGNPARTSLAGAVLAALSRRRWRPPAGPPPQPGR